MKREKVISIVESTVQDIGKSFLKCLVENSVKYIKNSTTGCIRIEEGSRGYARANKILYEMDPEKYDRHRIPTMNSKLYKLVEGTRYTIYLDHMNYISVNMSDPSAKGRKHTPALTIVFKGTRYNEYRTKFYEKCVAREDRTYIPLKYLGVQKINCAVVPHTFDNLILNDTIRDDIVKKLLWWDNNKDWYREHQLTHKIGVLLYGNPGTGKSALAKAISSMFGCAPIFTIDKENIIGSIREINIYKETYPGNTIVLIEDIDILFKKRAEEESKSKKDKSDSSLHTLFQLLDGVYSTEDTIYIATTNFKDKLDEALIRHGRFDIQHELTYFSYEDAVKFAKLFGYDESVLHDMDIQYPVQPAYLQNLIMEHKVKEIK